MKIDCFDFGFEKIICVTLALLSDTLILRVFENDVNQLVGHPLALS